MTLRPPKIIIILPCLVMGGVIQHSTIRDSTLNGISSIELCGISTSLVINSEIYYSTTDDCGVHDSKLHNCGLKEGVLTDSVVQHQANILPKLSCKIRKIIFVIVLKSEGLSSNIVAALRPLSLLYGDALETLFKEQEVWVRLVP